MGNLKAFYRAHRQVVLYILFGVLTTLVDFVVAALCNALLSSWLGEGNSALAANVLAWAAAVAFAFVTNKLYVFEEKSWARNKVAAELSSFVAARLLTLVLSLLLLYPFVKLWREAALDWLAPRIPWALSRKLLGQAYDLCVKLPTQVMVLLLNYILSKWVIFRKSKKEEGSAVQ